MNLTLQEVRERIDWLLENTTVMPTARTNVADIDLVNGVGREAHFIQVDSYGRGVKELERLLDDAEGEIGRLRSEVADLAD